MAEEYTLRKAIGKQCTTKNGYARMLGDYLSSIPLEDAKDIVGVLSTKMHLSWDANSLGYALNRKNKPLFEEMFAHYLKTGEVVPASMNKNATI